jgi:hypothetical protein
MDDENSLMAPWFVVAESTEECWECRADTKVFTILLPNIQNEKQPLNAVQYELSEEAPCSLINIEELNDAVEKYFGTLSKYFYSDYSRTISQTYWMNHCEHCGCKIGDFYLHKPEHAFFPITDEQIAKIKLTRVNIPIEAEAGWSQSSWIDDMLEQAIF